MKEDFQSKADEIAIKAKDMYKDLTELDFCIFKLEKNIQQIHESLEQIKELSKTFSNKRQDFMNLIKSVTKNISQGVNHE